MQHTGIKIFLIVLGFLWIPTVSFSLPNCPSDQTKRYHNCFGTYTNADGDTYVGEFKDDAFNGQGSLTFANGNRYVGEFKDNKRDGPFEVTFADGTILGESRYKITDKAPILCRWRQIHRRVKMTKNGQGTYTFADGDKYIGEYKDGKRNGPFEVTYADGDKYIGEFRDDKRTRLWHSTLC